MSSSGKQTRAPGVAVRQDASGRNIEDAAAFYAHLYNAHQIILTPTRETFSYRVRAVGDAVMTLRSSVVAGHRWGRLEPKGRYVLAWPQRGLLTINSGTDTEQLIRPGAAVMFPAGRPFTVNVAADTVLHTIDITAAFLEHLHHADTNQSSGKPHPLVFVRTPNPAALTTLQQHLTEAAPELLNPGLDPARRALLTRSVSRAILHTFTAPADDEAAYGVGVIGRAMQFITDHSAEPITAIDIAAAADCSPRTLQHAFARADLPTPMVALRLARLHMVRAALQQAHPAAASVAKIATAAGFGHVGRFASYYQQEFGELPRSTLHAPTPQAPSAS